MRNTTWLDPKGISAITHQVVVLLYQTAVYLCFYDLVGTHNSGHLAAKGIQFIGDVIQPKLRSCLMLLLRFIYSISFTKNKSLWLGSAGYVKTEESGGNADFFCFFFFTADSLLRGIAAFAQLSWVLNSSELLQRLIICSALFL